MCAHTRSVVLRFLRCSSACLHCHCEGATCPGVAYWRSQLEVPRDRNSEFEPQIVKKRQSVLDDLEDKIVALYSKGMTTRDIQEIMEDMYGVELSPSLISRLTDRCFPGWRSGNRDREEVYAVLWLDCIFYKVREEGKVINKAIYVVIGLGIDGGRRYWDSG